MKIAILGNGSIGCMAALNLSNDGHKVVLFGNKERYGSASKSSGAMLNVMGEVENDQFETVTTKTKFELGYNSQRKWNDFIKKNFSPKEYKSFKKTNTLVFKNDYSCPFEDKHFNYLKKHANNFPLDVIVKPKNIKLPKVNSKISDYMLLPREGVIDSRILLSKLDKLISKNGVKTVYGEKSYKVTKRNNKVSIKYKNKTEVFDYIVVALGSYSQKFNEINKKLIGKVPKVFFGTGTSFRVKKKKFTPDFEKSSMTVRTMNRGDACGFYFVPLNKEEFYFGATTSTSQLEENFHRISAVNILSNGLLNEWKAHYKENHVEILIGHRPTTSDTYPLLGPIDKCPQIIYATGTKRDGLTCSIEISDMIKDYVNGDKTSFEKYGLFKPNRNLLSFFDRETAIFKAAESSTAGFIMHNGKEYLNDWQKLVGKEKTKIEKVYKKLGIKNFGIHPEMVSLYEYKRMTY